MFSKKDGFKYEVEVNKLIKDATNDLNQRILALEMKNQQLLLNNQKLDIELIQLKNGLYNDIQRLEKKITDFTDIWHPIMMENINRIRNDLEKTITNKEQKDIQKVHDELENKLVKIINEKEETFILFKEPEPSKIRLSELVKQLNKKCEYYNSYDGQITFDLMTLYSMFINIFDDDNNIIINSINSNGKRIAVDYLSSGILPCKQTLTNSLLNNSLNEREWVFSILIKEKGFIILINHLKKYCPHVKLLPSEIVIPNFSQPMCPTIISLDMFINNINKYKSYLL